MKNSLRIISGIVTQFPLGQTPIDGPQPACRNGALTSPHQGQNICLPKHLKTLLDNKYCIAVLLLFGIFLSVPAKALDPYELQIYGYATQGKQRIMGGGLTVLS